MRLADAYASFGTEVRGSRFRFRSGSFGCVNYNSVPMLEASPQGLAFAVAIDHAANLLNGGAMSASSQTPLSASSSVVTSLRIVLRSCAGG